MSPRNANSDNFPLCLFQSRSRKRYYQTPTLAGLKQRSLISEYVSCSSGGGGGGGSDDSEILAYGIGIACGGRALLLMAMPVDGSRALGWALGLGIIARIVGKEGERVKTREDPWQNTATAAELRCSGGGNGGTDYSSCMCLNGPFAQTVKYSGSVAHE
ncbi:hypothetical protein M0802_003839 [Mischocyttarus mexicanus]|nr:hypothetical protein M0802_003839 [Mischocyttarus mexicanus]